MIPPPTFLSDYAYRSSRTANDEQDTAVGAKEMLGQWHLNSLGLLQRLPLELLENILLYSDVLTIIRAQAVSQAFLDIVKTSLALQYKIECYLADVTDTPTGNRVDLSDRRQKVRRWRKAWSRLHWSEKHTVPFRTRQTESALCVHYTVLGDACLGEEGTFQFVRQCTELRHVSAERWTISGLPALVKPEAWTFDVSQDVLAMLQIHDGTTLVDICFFSCKTGIPFREHGPSKISLNAHNVIFRSQLDDWDFNMRLYGNVISLLISHGVNDEEPHRELFIFNWHTREVILELFSEPDHSVALQDLGFIDEEHILCGGTGDDTDCIAVINHRAGLKSRMDFHTFIQSHAILILSLPPLSPEAMFGFLNICSSPRFSYISDSGIFRARRSEPLILIDLGIRHGDEDRLYNLIIPSHVVRSRLNASKADPNFSRKVSWDQWGLESRLFELPIDRFGQVSGSHYLLASRVTLGPREHERLVVCDFAPKPILQHAAAVEGAEVVWQHSVEEGATGPWERNIVTAAPYQVTVSDISITRYDQIILMQDGIIVIPFSGQGVYASSFDFYSF
ncbi:cytochrome P450 [Phanerochaete sordida]|uniref:Cytochrome P450 n=1 Tax=Phanerochaete sordida TaxID=48140 RepID=A0A9P3LJZ5_9APHY|nr:cytochrome P450 [Phanerochaete sordida]